jgi:hypothetical protein
MQSLRTRIKISLAWHFRAWKIARRIPWRTKRVWWSTLRKYGPLGTLGIYFGLVNLRLSDIAFLEWISQKRLIKICGA